MGEGKEGRGKREWRGDEGRWKRGGRNKRREGGDYFGTNYTGSLKENEYDLPFGSEGISFFQNR